MSTRRVHFATSRGFQGMVTACGKSTHGWQGPRTPVHTDVVRDVTCQSCLKKLTDGKKA